MTAPIVRLTSCHPAVHLGFLSQTVLLILCCVCWAKVFIASCLAPSWSHATWSYDHKLQHIFQPWKWGKRSAIICCGKCKKKTVPSLLCARHRAGHAPVHYLFHTPHSTEYLGSHSVSSFAFFPSDRIPVLSTVEKCPLTPAYSDSLTDKRDHAGWCSPMGSSWKLVRAPWESF